MYRNTLPTTHPPNSASASPNPKDSKIIILNAPSLSTPIQANFREGDQV